MESKISTGINTYTNKISNYSATHNNQNTYNPQTITIKSPVASDTINNAGNSNNQSNSDLVNGIRTFVDNVGERARQTAAFFGNSLATLGNNADTYIETEVLPTLENIGEAVGNTLLRTSATIDTAIVSLTEGLGQAGGALIDGTVNIGNALATPIYGLVDLGQHASVSLFGGEYHSLTERMWKDAKAFVSEEFVSPFYDEFYETNQTGKFLKDYAYGFKTTRELGDGVGYVGGIIITSILTAGAGDAASIGTAIASTGGTQAAIAGIAGLGKGSQEAWQDGATVGEGLAYGTLSGGWEAFQFWLGAQIAGSKLFIPATKGATVTVGNKILNSLSKVAMDGIDGGAEGFIQPLLKEIYKDGYYDQDGIYHDFNEESGRTIWDNYKSLFEENGGFKTVATNAAMGSIVSAIGEGIDVNRFIRNTRTGLNYYAFDNINSVTEDFLDKLDLETSMFVIDGKTYSGTELNDLLKNNANGNNTSNQAKNNRKLKPEVQKLHDEMDTILSKAKEDGRFSFFEFDYLKNLLDSRVDDIENYEYFYGIIKDFDGKCNLSRESGEYLNQILKDQNSVFAIHRTNLGEITKNVDGIPENSILSKIMDEGLINNGHALSGGGGAVSLTPDLNLTTTPLSGISGFLSLVGSYKDNNVTVILKFPDDLVSKDLVRGAENVHITKGNMSYINPDYIAGAIVKDENGFDQFFTKDQLLSKMKTNNDGILKDSIEKYKEKVVLETSINEPGVILEKMESELDLLKKTESPDVSRVETITNKIKQYKLAMKETEELLNKAKEKGFDSLGKWGEQKYDDVLSNLEKELNMAQKEKNFARITNLNKDIYELKTKYGTTSEMQSKADNLAKIYRSKAEIAEPAITKDMKDLETTNACLMGEDLRLKTEKSLSRKIISDTLEKRKNISIPLPPEEISNIMDESASEIGDSLRFTLVIDDADYVTKVNSSLNELINKGYTLNRFENTWSEDGYKGINTSLFAPDGTKMELQFHTAESYLVKEGLTHELYEVVRNVFIEQNIRDEANKIQKYYQKLIGKPKGVEELTKSNFISE